MKNTTFDIPRNIERINIDFYRQFHARGVAVPLDAPKINHHKGQKVSFLHSVEKLNNRQRGKSAPQEDNSHPQGVQGISSPSIKVLPLVNGCSQSTDPTTGKACRQDQNIHQEE